MPLFYAVYRRLTAGRERFVRTYRGAGWPEWALAAGALAIAAAVLWESTR